MKKLLIATTNPAKFEEARVIFAQDDVFILGLKDFPNVKPVAETGATCEENALLKAKGYFLQTGVPTIADDGGFEVEYLGGLPGVHARRWVGENATDRELSKTIIEKLRGVPREKRSARLGGWIAFWDGEHLLRSENWIEGYIADHPVGEMRPGFPYRNILIIPQFDKSYSELTEEEHEQVNFRRKNLKALKPKILEYLKEQ